MKTTILISVLVIGLMTVLFSTNISPGGMELPKGWFKAGDKPESYEMGVVKMPSCDFTKDQKLIIQKNDLIVNPMTGGKVATIKSTDKKIDGFGTLMQNCKPGNYLGNRVRMSGCMKTENVSDWAGLWFRVDGTSVRDFLAFDNMHDGKKNRSVKGTHDWEKYEIVLDVPAGATNLAYGALLGGTGQIWFDHITFEIVDNSVPTTGYTQKETNEKAPERWGNDEPTNLDFEK